MSQWAPILVALAALAFTIFSFWWMNWRTGDIIVAPPSTYAGHTQGGKLSLLFPLVFFNTGPVPQVVRDLRLRFADEPNGAPLDFERVRTGVSPSDAELVDLAAAFPVPGNEMVRLFCEFDRRPAGRTMAAGPHPLLLEALTDKRSGWQMLLEFTLNVDDAAEEQMPRAFIAYTNRPSE